MDHKRTFKLSNIFNFYVNNILGHYDVQMDIMIDDYEICSANGKITLYTA